MVKTYAADGTLLETARESRWLPDYKKEETNGGVAQLGEHLPCKQGVKSSNLSVSTVGLINPLKNIKPYSFELNRMKVVNVS